MNPIPNLSLLRIVDANCNRAREAARVLEDYARFTLNHAALSERLKNLRHDFRTATEQLQRRALPARDTPGDVGTVITTQTERTRESSAAVITAAAKRLGEALRTIEEYTKTLDGAIAEQLQALRYRAYDLEHDILLTLSPGRERMAGVTLCVLVTESLCRLPWLETARLALEGGADCLQLREKHLEGTELLSRAEQLAALCRKHNAISIINDRPDIALLGGADGVHVGQGDLPARRVRQLVGPDLIVGVSTHAIEQAQQAILDGADYIGAGPVFTSTTKPKPDLLGIAYAAAASQGLSVPALAISGITAANASQLAAAGVHRAAVSSAVLCADDPASAAAAIKAALQRKVADDESP